MFTCAGRADAAHTIVSGHIFGGERCQPPIDLRGSLRVSVKTHIAESRLDHPRIDGDRAHPGAQQILSQAFIDGGDSSWWRSKQRR